jgi:hypothetical protein
MADLGKLATYLTDNYLLGLAEPSGLEVLSHLQVSVGTVASSMTSALFNHNLLKRQIMPAFCKQISISLSCSAMFTMSFTLEWVVA